MAAVSSSPRALVKAAAGPHDRHAMAEEALPEEAAPAAAPEEEQSEEWVRAAERHLTVPYSTHLDAV